ncbi:hypothetical protein E3P81_02000 [Wallemia ichthyophaga]|uniref:Uncharacterized protein n=1 Tax=Wallemia ichthyophaga TaxID=245174 RepID=A0A4T0KPT4_WALIC|nr:hypothetical protein E3P97_01999 [Wallemia ichthyophaga]TIB06499.1 hypothetical protein E3P96_00375 [Wallemia ichthyophaga]TIB32898.1 hypothetical protein E3P85_01632 [Wallemia ichthyophaga]TIB36049.1 hypothetical protein E3P86_02562 [Wallemia ichthyophaga]TIB46864.1 hypothetical protein E3P82_01997 [Wallemia ichthyophaga]
MANYQYLLDNPDNDIDDGRLVINPIPDKINNILPSLYTLPKQLPPLKSLEYDAISKCEISVKHQQSNLNEALTNSLQGSSISPIGKKLVKKSSELTTKPKRPLMPWELFKAIETKDIMFIMTCRDHSFHLLLKKVGGTTPLVHAMRLGKEYDGIAIVLVGAMSKWVNTMDENTLKTAENRDILKSLRTNLKLAIDHGLSTGQTDLLASYLQTLVMSEGDKFINDATQLVAAALNHPQLSKPVQTATDELRKFATWRLDKSASTIASLDDYLSNGIADLVMMACWSQVLCFYQQGEPIPTYVFARDDRCFKTFLESLSAAAITIKVSASHKLKFQLHAIEKIMALRQLSLKERVIKLSRVLDQGVRLETLL